MRPDLEKIDQSQRQGGGENDDCPYGPWIKFPHIYDDIIARVRLQGNLCSCHMLKKNIQNAHNSSLILEGKFLQVIGSAFVRELIVLYKGDLAVFSGTAADPRLL